LHEEHTQVNENGLCFFLETDETITTKKLHADKKIPLPSNYSFSNLSSDTKIIGTSFTFAYYYNMAVVINTRATQASLAFSKALTLKVLLVRQTDPFF
jgi:hypothetical protein